MFHYDHLKLEELQAKTQADYLVSLNARFKLGKLTDPILDEPDFPVAELARSMRSWLTRSVDNEDFVFNSMSFEESGTVTIRRAASEWEVGSVLSASERRATADHLELHRYCLEFLRRVERDIRELDLDPDFILKE